MRVVERGAVQHTADPKLDVDQASPELSGSGVGHRGPSSKPLRADTLPREVRAAISDRSRKLLGVDITNPAAWSAKLVDVARDCALNDGSDGHDWPRVKDLVVPPIEVCSLERYPVFMPPEVLNTLHGGRNFNMLHWICVSCTRGTGDDDEAQLLEDLLDAGVELDTAVRTGSGETLHPSERSRTPRELLANTSTSFHGSARDPLIMKLYSKDHKEILRLFDRFDDARRTPAERIAAQKKQDDVEQAERGRRLHAGAEKVASEAHRAAEQDVRPGKHATRRTKPQPWFSSSSSDDEVDVRVAAQTKREAEAKLRKLAASSSSDDDA
jgi:hypothetical protein